ncbi:hypothetical protein [Kitasatospora sp. NPDC006786]|uniref:hypothetical protein n=1 Tax=unclassified Kitasatospora TaxID=2633591 RepID=UPI0033D00B7D
MLRLLTAVHEAGHAIVGHTVGLHVTGATVTNAEAIGLGGDHIAVDYAAYPAPIIPLPHTLAMGVAGFQASCTWLEGRGLDGDSEPYSTLLNLLANTDLHGCAELCRLAGLPASRTHDAVEAAGRILHHRWRATLRLAYVLTAAETMDRTALLPYLEDDPAQLQAAKEDYRVWRRDTAHLWCAGQ